MIIAIKTDAQRPCYKNCIALTLVTALLIRFLGYIFKYEFLTYYLEITGLHFETVAF